MLEIYAANGAIMRFKQCLGDRVLFNVCCIFMVLMMYFGFAIDAFLLIVLYNCCICSRE